MLLRNELTSHFMTFGIAFSRNCVFMSLEMNISVFFTESVNIFCSDRLLQIFAHSLFSTKFDGFNLLFVYEYHLTPAVEILLRFALMIRFLLLSSSFLWFLLLGNLSLIRHNLQVYHRLYIIILHLLLLLLLLALS